MAFNYLGTLSKEQLNDLRVFLSKQIEDIDQELNYLNIEKDNLKRVQTELIQADAAFGGTAQNILATIFGTGTDVLGTFPDLVVAARQDDRVSSIPIENAKRPFISTIKYKRERLEYKLKKISDAIEQNNEMIDRKAIAKTKTGQLLNIVESYFLDPKYKNFLFATTTDLLNYQKTGKQ